MDCSPGTKMDNDGQKCAKIDSPPQRSNLFSQAKAFQTKTICAHKTVFFLFLSKLENVVIAQWKMFSALFYCWLQNDGASFHFFWQNLGKNFFFSLLTLGNSQSVSFDISIASRLPSLLFWGSSHQHFFLIFPANLRMYQLIFSNILQIWATFGHIRQLLSIFATSVNFWQLLQLLELWPILGNLWHP